MKKSIVPLVLLLVVVLATTVSGCGKITGGGWFYDDLTADGDYPGNKVTFGLNVQPLDIEYNGWGVAEGNLQIVDHSQNIRVNGTSKYSEEYEYLADFYFSQYIENWWSFQAYECTVNGEGGYSLWAEIWDADGPGPLPSYAWIYVGPYRWAGELQRGNIKYHNK